VVQEEEQGVEQVVAAWNDPGFKVFK
jgi:hypothetical protein